MLKRLTAACLLVVLSGLALVSTGVACTHARAEVAQEGSPATSHEHAPASQDSSGPMNCVPPDCPMSEGPAGCAVHVPLPVAPKLVTFVALHDTPAPIAPQPIPPTTDPHSIFHPPRA